MWARDLLFITLLVTGISALSALLYPRDEPPRNDQFNTERTHTASFRASVAKVDAAFRQQWSALHLKPAPPASDLTIGRRLHLALMGTIPSLQEIRRFEAQRPDDPVQWWLAGILQDRRHADYLAERLARSYVSTEDGPFLVYRRRRFVSWLSDELMQNRPYDQIVRSLLTSEGLWTDKPETNFVTVTIEADKGPSPERLASRVARAFLGIRLDCAQCHNHPFEKWKQKDYQGIAAFFGQTKQGFTGIHDDGTGDLQLENRKTGEMEVIEPGVPFLAELLPESGKRRERLAEWITHPKNPYFARATVNRVWAIMFGQPLVDPVDGISQAEKLPAALDLLAADFAANNYDLQWLIQVIAATEVFHLDSAADFELTEGHEKAWAVFPVTRLRPEQVVGSLLQAGALETINRDSHIVTRMLRYFRENDFVRRHGDTGEDEFGGRSDTIPRVLLLWNGELVKEKTKDDPFNAATRIGWLAPSDRAAVATAYLTVLSRSPSSEEANHFETRLADTTGDERSQHMEDLYWTLVNATEFSWNH